MELPRIGFAKRLLVLYGVVFIFVLLVTDWTLSNVLQKRDLQQLRDSLLRQSVLIREIAIPLLTDVSQLRAEVKKLAAGTDLRLTIIDREGTILADSSEPDEALPKMDNHATRPEVAAALRKETGTSVRYSMTVETRMLYLAIPLLKGETLLGVVRTAMPVTQVDEILASVRRPVMLTALLGSLAVLVAGFLFSHRLTKRIRRITSVAERYAREDWTEKILMDGDDELKMLADTMNQMAASLHSRIDDLETEKGKISVILGHMNEGVVAIDRKKQCVMANPSMERLFGLTASDAQGKSLIEITRHPQLQALVDRAFEEHRTVSSEIHLLGAAKKTLRVTVIMLDAHIRGIGGILVFHDMTELRRLENTRKEFVANVSHELRTPLTSIKGFIETLRGGASKNPETSDRFLKIVAEETERLGRLVEDILTLGEIEQKIALLQKERVDLAFELTATLEPFKDRIEKNRLVVEDHLSGKPLLVPGNKDKIRQVFVNLLDNAIKFNTPGGKIILSADQSPEGITLVIQDTGIGIPEDARERIFERFFRVDKARSKELGGTGLGLAIVKHIMEAHGGRVSCQSTSGQGSRFSVFFPA